MKCHFHAPSSGALYVKGKITVIRSLRTRLLLKRGAFFPRFCRDHSTHTCSHTPHTDTVTPTESSLPPFPPSLPPSLSEGLLNILLQTLQVTHVFVLPFRCSIYFPTWQRETRVVLRLLLQWWDQAFAPIPPALPPSELPRHPTPPHSGAVDRLPGAFLARRPPPPPLPPSPAREIGIRLLKAHSPGWGGSGWGGERVGGLHLHDWEAQSLSLSLTHTHTQHRCRTFGVSHTHLNSNLSGKDRHAPAGPPAFPSIEFGPGSRKAW